MVLQSEAVDTCHLSRCPHSKLRVWASTSDFSAFSLSGPNPSFPPKLCEGALEEHSSCFQEEHGILREGREHYGNLLFHFCSRSLILCVMPQMMQIARMPGARRYFLKLNLGLVYVSLVLDLNTKQAHVLLLLLLFQTYSLGSLELRGSCGIYRGPHCSCYHFAPKRDSSYPMTLSLSLVVLLTYYSSPCLINLTL